MPGVERFNGLLRKKKGKQQENASPKQSGCCCAGDAWSAGLQLCSGQGYGAQLGPATEAGGGCTGMNCSMFYNSEGLK